MAGRKARAEGSAATKTRKPSNPVPGDDGEALERIAASFAERFPDEWAGLRNVSAECAIRDMVKLMKGKG